MLHGGFVVTEIETELKRLRTKVDLMERYLKTNLLKSLGPEALDDYESELDQRLKDLSLESGD
jgi:hypothetical protein